MKLPLLLLGLGLPAAGFASDFCERIPVDPEFPAGLSGSYEVVGKDSVSGKPYAGTVSLSYGKNTYLIKRVVEGRSVDGEAWIERCGIDKITTFIVRYESNPITEAACSLDADGDNYYRMTCRTREAKGTWRGLESWYQTQ